MNRSVYINTTSTFLPNNPIDNSKIEAVLGSPAKRASRAKKLVLRSNKIVSRYYAIDELTREPTHTNAQLAAEAIRALEVDEDDIDLLVCGTTLPDQLMPNHALMVHGELGTRACEVVATAGICLSGVMALKYAYLSLLAGDSQKAIVSASENASSVMRSENFTQEIEQRVDELGKTPEIAFEKDFLRWMLSDGAGAMFLTTKPNSNSLSLKIEWIWQKSYASQLQTCMYAGCEKEADGTIRGWGRYTPKQWLQYSIMSVKQDVKLLNEKIIEYTVTKPLIELVEKRGVVADEYAWYLPHYSSHFFKDRVYDGMLRAGFDIPQERWFTNLSTKGNTGSASIYIMLDELLKSGKLSVGEKILCYIPESGRFSTSFIELSVV